MKFLIYSLLLLTTVSIAKESTKPIKIAIVDTGINVLDPRFKEHVCATGHKDFTGEGLLDTVGHGTFVAGLIQKYAGKGTYCFLIYKYYSEHNTGIQNLQNEIKAFQEAAKNGAAVVNFSGGGAEHNKYEYLTIKNNPRMLFVVAAGNEGQNVDLPGKEYYPASYKLENIIPLGSIDRNGTKVTSSNWGSRITDFEIGDQVVSTLPDGDTGTMSGTSFATAIRTGKIVRDMLYAR